MPYHEIRIKADPADVGDGELEDASERDAEKPPENGKIQTNLLTRRMRMRSVPRIRR